jgi:hypothetical protein
MIFTCLLSNILKVLYFEHLPLGVLKYEFVGFVL